MLMAFDLLKARFGAVALAKSQVDGLQNLEAEKPVDTDFQIDRFIREWRELPARPEGAPPFIGLGLGRMMTVAPDAADDDDETETFEFDLVKARAQALALVRAKLEWLEDQNSQLPLPDDYELDTTIRQLRNLPPRPENDPPYRGLGFGKVSTEVLLTLQQLRHVMPQAKSAQAFLDPLNDCMQNYQINTPLRKAAFLAQLAHESGQLIFTREIWGPTSQQRKYEPGTRLASMLGNTQPGDGSRYRGRGLIQLTGRANYRSYTKAVRQRDPKAPDFEASPNEVADPQWATDCAGWFWSTRKLNPLADNKDFRSVTKRINGGFNGLEDRMKFYQRALDVFL
jgi:putative chitinase